MRTVRESGDRGFACLIGTDVDGFDPQAATADAHSAAIPPARKRCVRISPSPSSAPHRLPILKRTVDDVVDVVNVETSVAVALDAIAPERAGVMTGCQQCLDDALTFGVVASLISRALDRVEGQAHRLIAV